MTKKPRKADPPLGSNKWDKQIDLAVRQAANRISAEIDKMIAALPQTADPQNSIEWLVRELTVLQPGTMQLIMEDSDLREVYAETVASMPATARKPIMP